MISMCNAPDVAVVLCRPGDDVELPELLAEKLSSLSLPLKRSLVDRGSSAVAAIREAVDDDSERRICAVFELSLCTWSSFELLEHCQGKGIDCFRWQPSVAMFKRVAGSAMSSSWLAVGTASGFSEDRVTEERGWGYLSGDEELVVDTKTMTDEEISRFLDLPPPPTEGRGAVEGAEAEGPLVSELGYALDEQVLETPLPMVAAPLSEMARRVLLERATEPQSHWTLADGSPFPPEGQDGVFVSPLTGAPLFSSSQRLRSTTGWPSFAAASDNTPQREQGMPTAHACAQHLGRAWDASAGMVRLECVERSSGAHLGHDFEGTLCINAAALCFVAKGAITPAWMPRPTAPAIDSALQADPRLISEVRVATLGAGCFWSLRRGLSELPGVRCAHAGFSGGSVPHVTYDAVCSGSTGHVEAVQVAFDPRVISYRDLLDKYWHLVPDPTSSFRQGADVGPQYEPVIFYHSEEQRLAAVESRARLQAELDRHGVTNLAAERGSGSRVVTRIRPAAEFWVAAAEHQR